MRTNTTSCGLESCVRPRFTSPVFTWRLKHVNLTWQVITWCWFWLENLCFYVYVGSSLTLFAPGKLSLGFYYMCVADRAKMCSRLLVGLIPEFLRTFDRPALQMMLLQHGCLSHLKEVLRNFRSRESCPNGESLRKGLPDGIKCLILYFVQPVHSHPQKV